MSFHLAFFRKCTEGLSIASIVPASLFDKHAWFAHFSVCDLNQKSFHYAQRRSLGGVCDANNKVWVRDWFCHEQNGQHQLYAQSSEHTLNLTLSPIKPLSLHGDQGVFTKTEQLTSTYQTISRMSLTGRIEIGQDGFDIKGQGWMDHESGPFRLNSGFQGWDWFALQLDNHSELMIYRLRDSKGNINGNSRAIITQANGSTHTYSMDQCKVVASDHWTSPKTNICYPVKWHILLAELELDITVNRHINCAELDTRGSSCQIYWEGSASVTGTMAQREITGNAYVELVGYNESIRAGSFDYDHNNISMTNWLYCSLLYHRSKLGVSVSD